MFSRVLLSTNIGTPQTIRTCIFDGTGCVLLSKFGEFDHVLRNSAILVYEHNYRGTVGLVLGKTSPFTMGEMAPNMGVFAPNALYRGGSEGSDTAVMVHKYDLEGSCKSLGKGLFVGGLKEAKQLVDSMKANPKDFNFVFNNVQWAPGVLESEISAERWDVCEVSPDLLLSFNLHRDHDLLWKSLHNTLHCV